MGAPLNLLPYSSLILGILSPFLHITNFHFFLAVLRHPRKNSCLQSQHLTLGSCGHSAAIFSLSRSCPQLGGTGSPHSAHPAAAQGRGGSPCPRDDDAPCSPRFPPQQPGDGLLRPGQFDPYEGRMVNGLDGLEYRSVPSAGDRSLLIQPLRAPVSSRGRSEELLGETDCSLDQSTV